MTLRNNKSKADCAAALADAVTKDWPIIVEVFRKSAGMGQRIAFGRLARAQSEYSAAVAAEASAVGPNENNDR